MKTLTKDSVAKCLLVVINTAYFLLLISVILLTPRLFQNSEFFIVWLEQNILFYLILIMLWYLRIIGKAFKDNLFYEKRIVKALKHLSLLLLSYVIIGYGLYLFKNYGKSPISTGSVVADIIEMYIKPINFSLLFLSAITFLLSFVAKEGYELKEENNLTI